MAAYTPTYLVLDIETVPDRTLWTPPEPPPASERGERPPERQDKQDRALAFPPPYACQPVVIGVMWLDEALGLRGMATLGEDKDEAGMLAELAELMNGQRPHLVTWNGRGFDLPVLALRSLRHGLSWPWYYRERDYRYRYSDEGHLDLCDFLADHGATRAISLDGAARLIGLPGKGGGPGGPRGRGGGAQAQVIDGSQVEGLYQAGEMEALRRYCLEDVTQTAFLFLRARLLTGQLELSAYRRAAAALLAGVAADGRLARLAAAVDRPRLLLDPAGA